ncbi:sensor histidine kinase [Streptomyces sp. NPDC026092]|uniref:sensor histidine kinase n=1 Tax=Streptomyces sp. NPDC026092 TaxID=3154797 RepID=UPI0033F34CC6
MPSTTPLPLVRRVSLATWTVLAWCAGALFAYLMRTGLPGESEPAVRIGVLYLRWDGLLSTALATAGTLAGARLLSSRPLPALGMLLFASVTATMPLGVAEIPLAQFLAVDVALYAIAAQRPRRTGFIALALALAVLVGFLSFRLVMGWEAGTSAELAVALTAVVAWLLGRSSHQARVGREHAAAQAAARAVTDERLRIAREMHDMVAHSIGVIALQAGAAARVVATQPDAAREAMTAVEHASRETLSGLRRMLGALREHEQPDGAGLKPIAGLADVEGLAAATTAVGVRVDVTWHGERRPLPPDIDLSAFRIIQESVTNVVRHAATDSCRVTVDAQADELRIEVVDDGRGERSGTSPGTSPGYGLAGMRERVALLHGEFSAAPRPEGGFRVAARLPVPPASPVPTGVR